MKVLLSLIIIVSSFAYGQGQIKETRTFYFKKRYNLKNVNEKLINNHGEGFEDLYGVRNFRVVLHGVLYRGGANNKWHKKNPKQNMNPLQIDALDNLCREGFSKVVYLYSHNYKNAPKSSACTSRLGKKNQTPYLQKSALYSEENAMNVLSRVFQVIQNPKAGPVFAHCWNGWHASGYVSAIALRQWCGYTENQAVEYWIKNTDGHHKDPRYKKVIAKVRAFKPKKDLKITAQQALEICP